MLKNRFYNDHSFLPTQDDNDRIFLEVWEDLSAARKKKFEKDLEAENPEAFRHFRDNVLINHPDYNG